MENLSYEDKEEILSDVFFIIWKNKEKITTTVEAYAAGITRILVKEKLRKKKITCNIDELENVASTIDDLNENISKYFTNEAEGTTLQIIGTIPINDGIVLFEVMLIKLDYAFNTLNMNRITGKAFSEHPISLKFMEALKYKYEGTFRQSIFKNGKYK